MGLKYALAVFSAFFMFSCVSQTPHVQESSPIDAAVIEQEQYYEKEEIVNPGRPEPTLLTKEGEITEDPSKAEWVAYNKKEFSKVVAQFKRGKALEEQLNKVVELHNAGVDVRNELAKLIAIQQEIDKKKTEYLNYQIDFNNQLKSELAWLRGENIALKAIILSGTIILVALAF